MERCDECKYWDTSSESITTDGTELVFAICRRYPPSRNDTTGEGDWPFVCQCDWCGEFVRGECRKSTAIDGFFVPKKNWHVSLSELNLTPRAMNALGRAGMECLGDLHGKTWLDLLCLRNFGERTLGVVRSALAESTFGVSENGKWLSNATGDDVE